MNKRLHQKKETYYIRVFNYIEELDCFVVNKEYEAAAKFLGLMEWSTVVWLGRYFCTDNDFGEHWFDNWEERDKLRAKAKRLGYDEESLFVIDPNRFVDKKDGPCHSAEMRKKFWTDVLTSLRISLSLMIDEARMFKSEMEKSGMRDIASEDYIDDLEKRIKILEEKFYS